MAPGADARARRTAPPLPPAASDEARAEAAALAARAPRPAVVGNVLTGTAGWTDPTLLRDGRFYPPGEKGAGLLTHYARHFRVVEVDATYYSLLAPDVAAGWVARTDGDFRVHVKAFPVFTGHPIDVRRLPAELRELVAAEHPGVSRVRADALSDSLAGEMRARFVALLAPLRAAGRLASVQLQLPPWIEATRGAARRVEAAVAALGGAPVTVEFRHPSWLEPTREARVLAWLTELGATLIIADEPHDATRGTRAVDAVTRPELAVFRLHGHNLRGWSTRGATVHQRFDYLYRPAELSAFVPRVRRVADRAREVHVVFNNCVRDYAVVGAQGLAALLLEPSAPRED